MPDPTHKPPRERSQLFFGVVLLLIGAVLLADNLGFYIPLALWKGTWEGEATLIAKGGERIPVSLVLIAHPSMREDDDVPYFLSVMMRDLRSRLRTEARLRASEQRLKSRRTDRFAQ